MAGYGIGHNLMTIMFQKGQAQDFSTNFNLSNVHLPIKYPNGIPLKAVKIKVIKYLSKFVEPHYQQFYTDLFRAQEQISVQVRGGDKGDDSDLDDPATN